jgi:hypothetical protein
VELPLDPRSGTGRHGIAEEGGIDPRKTTALRCHIPQGTLCSTTALARHGLTDNIPARIDVAIPRGNRIPTLLSPVDVRVFAKDTFELGGGLKVGEGFAVGLYSPERSLVDMIRLRHREGSDVAWE